MSKTKAVVAFVAGILLLLKAFHSPGTFWEIGGFIVGILLVTASFVYYLISKIKFW